MRPVDQDVASALMSDRKM